MKSAWKYIFEDWFPGSGYIYDESKLDFEFYDERCHPRPAAMMDIAVPVTRPSSGSIGSIRMKRQGRPVF